MALSDNVRWRFPFVVHAFNASSALAGGGALAIWTDGSVLHTPPGMLAGTGFTDYLFPGLLLFAAVGVTNMIAAMLTLRREPGAEIPSFLAGLATVGWIIGELFVLKQFSWFQVLYLITGLALMVDAGWIFRERPRYQPARSVG